MKKEELQEKENNIYGRNAVLELLKTDQSIDVLYLSNGELKPPLKTIVYFAKERKIPVRYVPNDKLDQLSAGERHQGVVATLPAVSYLTLEELLAHTFSKTTSPFFILADGIEDPHNLGAIIRTADAAGADGLILPRHRSATLNGTVYKTSAGAALHLPVARVTNLTDAIETLKQHNIWIYGADMDGSSFWNSNLSGSIAIVIGSEGKGLGQRVRNSCDAILSIPMFGAINSLNASVAAGLLLYEVARNRQDS